ncbi:helix-turn-helix domain-containing protein [Paenibacillus sp. USHLN196]
MIERSRLEILHQQGESSRAIAKELDRLPVEIAFGVAVSKYPTGALHRYC